MKIKVMNMFLMNVFKDSDFIFQRGRVFVMKTLIYRSRGIENLSSCFDNLTEAISLLKCAIDFLSELNFEAHHTLSAQLKPSVKSTIAMLFYTLDLLLLKVFLKFHLDMYVLINILCKFGNF
ncbi:hypothetical protein KSP39_PZI008947 [Platanthera zijinensis]|uniref:Uncharacterized protein n=1 Tax=Platanthera zijinensis TaxID=2320716 RepID=A0AAP0BLH6_9ASPA